MLSKNKIKLIKSLDSKKERIAHRLFVAEGEKITEELIDNKSDIIYLAGTEKWYLKNKEKKIADFENDVVSDEELKKASFLKTPQNVLCLVKIPVLDLNLEYLQNDLSLILDNVQDPGNLGTIVRIADWFGIGSIICSPTTADVYNPKVVQATMGAISRVKVYYENLDNILLQLKQLNSPIYGTTLEGENIYTSTLTPHGFIVMGNESNGLRPETLSFLNKQLFIPFFPENQKRSESLNVAIATSIVCSEFRRRS